MDYRPLAPIPRAESGDGRVIRGLASATLRRDAIVESAVGGTGRLKHVVVHPETREVTGLVILHEGSEWLVPVREVSAVVHNRIRLRAAWSRYQRRTFDRACFRPVSPSGARATSNHGAEHDGSPLLDAGRSHVRIGTPSEGSTGQVAGQGPSSAGTEGARARLLDQDQQRRLRELEQEGVIRVTRRAAERLETIEVPVHEETAIIELTPAGRTDRILIGDEELWQGERLEVMLSTERIQITKERVGPDTDPARQEVVERRNALATADAGGGP